jgi:hypothetical protein
MAKTRVAVPKKLNMEATGRGAIFAESEEPPVPDEGVWANDEERRVLERRVLERRVLERRVLERRVLERRVLERRVLERRVLERT